MVLVHEKTPLNGGQGRRETRIAVLAGSMILLGLVCVSVMHRSSGGPNALLGHNSIEAETGIHPDPPKLPHAHLAGPKVNVMTAADYEARLGKDVHGHPLSKHYNKEGEKSKGPANKHGKVKRGVTRQEDTRVAEDLTHQPHFKQPLARNPIYQGTGKELSGALDFNKEASAAAKKIVHMDEAQHKARTLSQLGDRTFFKFDPKKGNFYSFSPDKGAVAKPGSIADTLTKIRASASAPAVSVHVDSPVNLPSGNVRATAQRLAKMVSNEAATKHAEPWPSLHYSKAAKPRHHAASHRHEAVHKVAPDARLLLKTPVRLNIIGSQGMATAASEKARQVVTQ